MLIDIHVIQNHCPANLNRDDLGAPKTCYFGGVLRSRISSQCLKRSIRKSEQFRELCGGIRTRRLAAQIAEELKGDDDLKAKERKKAEKILEKCGLMPKKSKKSEEGDGSKMLVYTTRAAIKEMADLLKESAKDDDKEIGELAKQFGKIISTRTAVPDMALAGRMLETGEIKDTTVEAALQCAHAISTHEARPEIDYYVAADDVPGDDAGAGYVDEAMFSSACFYKYFSIHWETLLKNLEKFGDGHEKLAAHTVGAFIRAAALANPTGKQNSFAAHNPPDLIVAEIRSSPISYANAFAAPVGIGDRDLISQSVAQLANYAKDLDEGYGAPDSRFSFSPNNRNRLIVVANKEEVALVKGGNELGSLEDLVAAVVAATGQEWDDVRRVKVELEAAS